jgi:hypothetical protein
MICIIVIINIIYWQIINIKEGLEDHQKDSIIPLHIYQTWHTKKLPPKMQKCVDKLKKNNPEFKHHIYNIEDCRKFIEKHFDKEILDAYDKLKPLAYKADLWRYCVLYKKGGIYLDIKYQCKPKFKLIKLIDKEYFMLDCPYVDENISHEDDIKIINKKPYYNNIYNKIDTNKCKNKNISIANGFIICKPKNDLMYECIKNCVKNIKNNYYGFNPLYPTGPGLLGDLYFKGDFSKIDTDINIFNSINGKSILMQKNVIFKYYDGYRYEQTKNSNIKHYSILWNEKNIYNN